MVGDGQWDLIDWLNAQSGHDIPFPQWREALYNAASAQRAGAPQKYRDVPLDEGLLAEAAADGIKAWHAHAQAAEFVR